MATTKVRDAQAIQSVDLTSEVTGALPTGNGGTGSGTLATARSNLGLGNVDLRGTIQVTNTTSWTIDADTYKYGVNTGLTGAVTINNPTGTFTEGETLWIALTGTAARAISYGTAFEDSGNVTRPTTTTGTARLDIGFIWNSATSKWRCIAYA